MNSTQPTKRKNRFTGFSLVEVLTAIAILGVITGMIVPILTSVNSNARASVARRNAQSVSSTYAVAKNAGVDWDSSQGSAAIVVRLKQGVSPLSGPFVGKVFIIPSLPSEDSTEFAEMMSFLDWDPDNVQLNYNSRL